MGPIVHASRTKVILFAAVALRLAVQAPASDCDGNGVDDAIDVQASGPGYRLMRKLRFSAAAPALADMNADGAVDVVGLADGEVTVALGEGSWRWTEFERSEIPPGHDLLVVEDLDRDGRSDVVTAGDPGISFLFNRGNGDLEPGPDPDISIGSILNDIQAADVNGDGSMDLVTWNLLSNISIVINEGGRRFDLPRNYASLIRPRSRADTMAIGDLDRDGYPDVALATSDYVHSATVVVLWNDGSGAYGESSSWARTWLVLDMLGYADEDGDGNGDLLLQSAGALVAIENNGSRVLTGAILPSESVDAPALIEDLDRDGSPEITFWRGGCDGFVVLSRSGGSYAESARVAVRGSQHRLPRAADMDGDDDLDLAVFGGEGVRMLSREASIARGDCNANGLPDSCEDDCNGNGVPDVCDITTGESEDCDANARPDECDTDCNANEISDACEVRDGRTDDCNGNGIPDACDLPDTNRNGVPDGCEIASGEAPDCNGNGIIDGSETVPRLPVHTPAVSGLAMCLSQADMDSDGYPDLLARTSGGETEIVFWDDTGRSPLFTRAVGIRAARNAGWGESIAALDVDSDADPDLALLAATRDCNPTRGLVTLENEGDEKFGVRRWLRFEGLLPDSILADDFDGDARIDLVAWGTGGFLWFLRGIPGGFEEPRLLLLEETLAFGDVATIDVDLDGDLDLATDTGFFLDNRGGGAFHPEGTFPAGAFPPEYVSFVEAADLGGDGLEDIVTGGLLAENEGGGGFRERTLTGEDVLDAALGDFDADGLNDAVLSLRSGLRVHLQRAGGFAVTNAELSLGQTIEALDMNRDGRLDLAALSHDAILVHLNVTDPPLGGFTKRSGDGFVTSLAAVDLDGDGDTDLAGMAGAATGQLEPGMDLRLEFWRNEASGIPPPETAFQLGNDVFFLSHRMSASDMDLDGDVDFALPASGGLILLERGVGGQLLRVNTGAELSVIPLHVTAVDMDEDGIEDLCIATDAGEVFVLFGIGWPRFEVAPVVTAISLGRDISTGDLDADGDPDLVATRFTGILPITNEGNRAFSLRPPLSPMGLAESSVLADFDGDGDLDLAASHCDRSADCREESLITFFRNDGLGSFGLPMLRPLHHLSQDLEAADLDGDGYMDLVAAQGKTSRDEPFTVGNTVEVFLNERGVELDRWALVRIGVTGGPTAIGDFDGDGVRDLAVGSPSGVVFLPLRVLPPSERDTDGDGVLDSCGSVPFRRGDWNSDARLDLTDAVLLLGRLFLGGVATGCDDAGDADDDGKLDLSDPLRILRHLFQGDPEPPPPHVDCGSDPTPDELSCNAHASC